MKCSNGPMATGASGLNELQTLAFHKIISGHSLFLTGSAGTGKSHVIGKVRDFWTNTGRKFLVCAPTGVAAVLIGGRTFHSCFWLRPDDESPDVSAAALRDRLMATWPGKKLCKTLKQLDAILIDEVSMMSPLLLAKVSDMLKLIRFNGGAFGGMQIVLVGDFFQLAPVKDFVPLYKTSIFYEMVHTMVELQDIVRQGPESQAFRELLGRLRLGALTPADVAVLQSRVGLDVTRNGVAPTVLYATNRDVDSINAGKLDEIHGPLVGFERHAGYRPRESTGATQLEKFLKDLRDSGTVVLKGPVVQDGGSVIPGAQVMLTYNLSTEMGLVNGSRGVVVDFVEPDRKQYVHRSIFDDFDEDDPAHRTAYIKGLRMPKVTFLKPDGSSLTILVPYVRYDRQYEPGKLVYAWTIPLRLAWATTVHKSQGQSLDCVSIALDASFFAEGQAYVAVSRARSLEGLTFTSFDPKAIRASSDVIQFYSKEFGTYRPTA